MKTVYCSTWRLGREMSTTTKKYEPFPPKIETGILDVTTRQMIKIKSHDYFSRYKMKQSTKNIFTPLEKHH